MTVCSVAGCERDARARGLCKMHHKRSRNGIPLDRPLQSRYNGEVCYAVGCDRPAQAKGLCDTHWARNKRNGDPNARQIAPKGSGSSHGESGYRVVYAPDHPVANKAGKAFEHRVVLFDAIGPGEHPCHWCEVVVTWDETDASEPRTLVVDHVNHVRDDNRAENLVPSCWPCNAARIQPNTEKRKVAAT